MKTTARPRTSRISHGLSLLVLLTLLIPLVACGGRQPISGGPAPAEPSAYPGQRYLVSAQQLHDRLDEPNLRIIDLSPIRDYQSGHIPGATHVWWQDTIETHNDIYGMLAGEDELARIVREAGITPQSSVVLYDASGNRYAARLLWALNVYGFDNVAVVNGGRQAWEAAGYKLTHDEPSLPPGQLPLSLSYDALIGDGTVHDHLSDGSLYLIDDRTPEQQAESWFGQLKTGRIPGAALIPWTNLVDPGTIPYYRTPSELSALFQQAGVGP